jgi:hypothetical protein
MTQEAINLVQAALAVAARYQSGGFEDACVGDRQVLDALKHHSVAYVEN